MRSTDVTHKETKGKEPPLPAKAIRLEDRVAPDDGLKTSCSTLFKPIGLISHYHENCHYRTDFELTPEGRIDKRMRDKLSELKRMILTIRMTQTPLELNYNGRRSVLKKSNCRSQSVRWDPTTKFEAVPDTYETSQIPIPSKLRPSTAKSGRTKQIVDLIPQKKNNGPFVRDLVPLCALSTISAVERFKNPYRSKFEATYERTYNELLDLKHEPYKWQSWLY